MRKYLLPKDGHFYKANLHSHSTFSDGRWTPEKMKEEYKAQGYSILAFTDHETMVDHSELDDENFLTLKGYEVAVQQTDEQKTYPARNTCEFCLIALDPETKYQVLWHSKKYERYAKHASIAPGTPDYERIYSIDGVNDMIRIAREAGFFVTYNHIAHSHETAEQYLHYNGMHAMEIANYGCIDAGLEDYMPYTYDEMLRADKHIYCIATDDNHNNTPDSFGCFTVIKADKLDYKTVTDAMLRGDMYASQKPLIEELWYEDGKVHIKCTPARKIALTCGTRHIRVAHARDRGPLTEATFDVDPNCVYFRLTVTDFEGYPANTRAYFMEELK